jgi:hypothetical protein
MADFQSLSANRLLFDLAARLGSLEGYLYAEEKVDRKYLPNWLQNIEREFNCLSIEVRNEIQSDYVQLLSKVHGLLTKAYSEQDSNTAKVASMLVKLPKEGSSRA